MMKLMIKVLLRPYTDNLQKEVATLQCKLQKVEKRAHATDYGSASKLFTPDEEREKRTVNAFKEKAIVATSVLNQFSPQYIPFSSAGFSTCFTARAVNAADLYLSLSLIFALLQRLVAEREEGDLGMCKLLAENVHDSLESHLANKPAGFKLRKNLIPLEAIYQEIARILPPIPQNSPSLEHVISNADQQSHVETPTNIIGFCSTTKEDHNADAVTKIPTTESGDQTESSKLTEQELQKEKSNSPCNVAAAAESSPNNPTRSPQNEPTSLPSGTGGDVEMVEEQHAAVSNDNAPTNGSRDEPGSGVIVLDD